MTDAQVAVLGGGISGCLTACLLADEGVRVVIVEQRDELLMGASLWNDGKIHLGHLFIGVPSLATAALMQHGAAVFLPTLERVLGAAIPPDVLGAPVMYLVDRGSMVDPEVLWGRAQAVAALLERSTERLPGLRAYEGPNGWLERIAPERATELTGQTGLSAAWRTTEIHCAARVIADLLRDAVAARAITVLQGRVTAVKPIGDAWCVMTNDAERITAPVVVNCTWESRTLIDRHVAPASTPVSTRYKYGLFGRGARTLGHLNPSTRIIGRYGDIATYRNGDAYLSWYPAGLAARSDDGVPPVVPPLDASRMTQEILRGLALPPSVLQDPGATWEVGGGFVVAHGHGDIDRSDSPLHERDRPAVHELRPGYVSVDTGKYGLGPLMALRASAAALRHLGDQRARGRRHDRAPVPAPSQSSSAS